MCIVGVYSVAEEVKKEGKSLAFVCRALMREQIIPTILKTEKRHTKSLQ